MKEYPILFSTPMVQAILEGRKSQTRRLVRETGKAAGFKIAVMPDGTRLPFNVDEEMGMLDYIKCPYGGPGDTLWAKETFCYTYDTEDHPELEGCPQEQWDTGLAYKADGKPFYMFDKWEPSIFMPRTASRITLKITDIRVERLQDISEEDAIAEGIETDRGGYKSYEIIHSGPHKGKPNPHSCVPNRNAVYSYRELWESINGKGSWDANPWVWVIKFERI